MSISSSESNLNDPEKNLNQISIGLGEEDEDYVPGVDDGDASEDEEKIVPMDEDDNGMLSITKQKAVDDAFFELFGYSYTPTVGKSIEQIPIKASTRSLKQRRILSSIFGKNSCFKLMSRAKSTAALARPKPTSGGMIRLEKRVIKEVKRFAGQEISVEKVVMVPVMMGETINNEAFGTQQSTESIAAAAAVTTVTTTNGAKSGPAAKGLDSLLTTLSRPEKLSTISKTSADWDLFKTKNAPEFKEELENKAQGKEAYLVKKDFLNRVDERRFEIERGERDRERAKRGK